MITTLSADEDARNDPDKPEATFNGTLTIPFKNENLFAEHTAQDGQMTVLYR